MKSKLWNYENDVINDYNNGLTLFKLANKYNVSHTTIRNFLRRHNIVLKRRGTQRKVSEETLLQFINAAHEKKETYCIRRTAKNFGVSETTLRTYLKKLVGKGVDVQAVFSRFGQKISGKK